MDSSEENENIISSDEYSDEDYDDALMIGAIRSQDQNVRSGDYGNQHKPTDWRIDQKQKQISSLLRRNKISVIYKKKSIKWLNNKRQRERYRKHLYHNANNVNTVQIELSPLSVQKAEPLSENHQADDPDIQEIANVEKKETNFDMKFNAEGLRETNNTLQNTTSLCMTNHANQSANINSRKASDQGSTTLDEENMQDIGKLKGTNKQTNEIPMKMPRSKSSPVLDQSNDKDEKCSENKCKSEPAQFHIGINNMFPNFDKIATNHINNITNNCSNQVEEKMKDLSIEIDSLNEIILAKEKELNRLSYLKMVKEEIYFRLDRKRHTLLLKDGFANKQHQYSTLALKELEISLSDKKEAEEGCCSSKTIQKLIENRANMNTDDLKREKNNTNRLHSLLVSQNMLHATEVLGNSSLSSSGKKIDMLSTNQGSENSNYINGERSANNIGRLRDFREENPDMFPRADKRIKLSDLNAKPAYSYPLFQKDSRSQLFNEEQKSEFSPLPSSVNEISITPIGRSTKLSSSLENVRLGDRYIKSKIKGNLNGKCPTNIQYPLCQECKAKESRFVCAGCGNQWYCSRNCQITAWDIHSEICTE